MKRYEIKKDEEQNAYVVIDKFKIATCLQNKRYTKRAFKSVEMAHGFMFGKGKASKVTEVSCV